MVQIWSFINWYLQSISMEALYRKVRVKNYLICILNTWKSCSNLWVASSIISITYYSYHFQLIQCMNKGRKSNCCILEGKKKKKIKSTQSCKLLLACWNTSFTVNSTALILLKTSSHFSYNFNKSIFHVRKMEKQKGQISSWQCINSKLSKL